MSSSYYVTVFREYSISSTTGFLPESLPIQRLEHYKEWEELVKDLPQLIKNKQLRDKVQDLPLLPISHSLLPTEDHWRRAYSIITFICQGYLWERGEKGTVSKLPQQLAIPWWEISSHCGLPPVATYTSSALWNWSLKDQSAPISLNNLQTQLTFTGTRSEEWFYLVPLGVELAAVPGIKGAVNALAAVKNNDIKEIIINLKDVAQSIIETEKTFLRMYEECEPDAFYNVIRPFQAGTKNMAAFSNGLIYEGVDKEPKIFGGASAGQSSTLPVFDILLGVVHHGTAEEFLYQQRWHMPRHHRQFLLYLSQQPSLREFVLQHKNEKELVDTYNNCVKQLEHLRSEHIILVTRYIVSPAAKQHITDDDKDGTLTTTGIGGLAITGTGGSDFMIFLKSVRDNTSNCIII